MRSVKVENNAAQVVGIIAIVISVLLFIIILISFDWSTYYNIKDLTYTYAEEIEIMKMELMDTWIIASFILIGGVVSGIVLITLGRILGVLEIIVLNTVDQDKQVKDNEQTKDSI